MFSLVIKSGPAAGRRVELDSSLVVGRGTADLAIDDDPGVSRRHALFRTSEGTLEVEDLGSSNGTRVNGEQISTPTQLISGDVVALGGTVIEIHVEPARTRIEARGDRGPVPATDVTPVRAAGSALGVAPAGEPRADIDESVRLQRCSPMSSAPRVSGSASNRRRSRR